MFDDKRKSSVRAIVVPLMFESASTCDEERDDENCHSKSPLIRDGKLVPPPQHEADHAGLATQDEAKISKSLKNKRIGRLIYNLLFV